MTGADPARSVHDRMVAALAAKYRRGVSDRVPWHAPWCPVADRIAQHSLCTLSIATVAVNHLVSAEVRLYKARGVPGTCGVTITEGGSTRTITLNIEKLADLVRALRHAAWLLGRTAG